MKGRQDECVRVGGSRSRVRGVWMGRKERGCNLSARGLEGRKDERREERMEKEGDVLRYQRETNRKRQNPSNKKEHQEKETEAWRDICYLESQSSHTI